MYGIIVSTKNNIITDYQIIFVLSSFFNYGRMIYLKKALLCITICGLITLCGCADAAVISDDVNSAVIESDAIESNVTSESDTVNEENSVPDESETVSVDSSELDEEETYFIDYGDAESFEKDLNDGKNLEGKVVQFLAKEIHPNSKLGYNVWAGEHLNFVSSRNPDINQDDIVTVKTTTIESVLGSWIIRYEKIDNAEVKETTIFSSDLDGEDKGDTISEVTESEKDSKESKNDSKVESKAAEKEEYEKNSYFDIVEESTITNSIGTTIVINKVKAKKDGTVDATFIVTDSNDNVIGKSSDSIVLTKGEYNYFEFHFDADITNARITKNLSINKDSFMVGDRKAVEMVSYNQSEDDLYVTFKQVSDDLGTFAKFKLMLYKGDQLVSTENGYFSVYAKNLNGKDSTDVASLWVYGDDFDRVEYIFEP